MRTGGIFAGWSLRVLELSEPPTQTALRGHDFVDGEFPEGDFFWLAALQAARAPVMERESLRNAKTAFDQVLPGVDGSTFIVRQSLNASALPRSSFRWEPHGPAGHEPKFCHDRRAAL